MWQCPLVDWDLSQQKRHWETIDSFLESRRTLPYLCHASKEELACSITSVNWFSRWCDGLSKISFLGNASRKIPRLHEITKLENQLQGWSLLKNSRSSSHNSVDQRSWDSKVNWRSDDIAIGCGGNRFSRLRYAWCDDCICIEKASRQASALPKKSKCRRAACSEIRPILTMEADFFCDLRAFSSNHSLWSSTGIVRFCSIYVCRTTISWFSMHNGTKLYCQQAKRLQKWSWKDCTSQISGFYSDSDCIGLVWQGDYPKQWATTLSKVGGICEATCWSDDPQWHCGKRRNYKGRQGKKACFERKVGECFRWKAHGQRSKGDLCSFRYDSVSGNGYEAQRGKDNTLLLRPIQRQRLTGQEPWKDQAAEVSALGGEGQIPLPKQKLWSLVK